ncbi:hypothetical protein ACFQT0_06150 [Hymenobacter humi]|uniref:Uncharacterized protein n=1 Tax=Hymenobacter humi TaxID=1411620 RepID=A0ABW2U3I3_9BACT
MLSITRLLRAVLPVLVGLLLLASPAHAQKQKTKLKGGAKASYPAAEGFDAAGSDAKAVAIADRVMREMGGYENWKNARYFAWSFLAASTRFGTSTPATSTGKKTPWWPTTT